MNAIDNLITEIKQLESNISLYIRESVEENEAFILDMNTENQLFELGVNIDGVKIGSYAPYKDITVKIKRLKGQPTSRVTLRDEGDFHRSFFLDISNDGFFIDASDEKTQRLAEKYSSDFAKTNILGLTEENIEILTWDYIYPTLIHRLKQKLL